MILVDTSIWIDHLHRPEPELERLLLDGRVATHSSVIRELALGSVRNRRSLLKNLESLTRLRETRHEDLMRLIESRELWGKGLSAVDVGLLAAVLITPGTLLWTRDKRLRAEAIKARVAYEAPEDSASPTVTDP